MAADSNPGRRRTLNCWVECFADLVGQSARSSYLRQPQLPSQNVPLQRLCARRPRGCHLQTTTATTAMDKRHLVDVVASHRIRTPPQPGSNRRRQLISPFHRRRTDQCNAQIYPWPPSRIGAKPWKLPHRSSPKHISGQGSRTHPIRRRPHCCQRVCWNSPPVSEKRLRNVPSANRLHTSVEKLSDRG